MKERGRERKKQKERKGEATASARQNCVVSSTKAQTGGFAASG